MDDDIRRARELVSDMGQGNGAGDILARAFMKSQDEIERLRAATVMGKGGYEYISSYDEIVAAERERCAKLVEDAGEVTLAAAIRKGEP